MACCEPDRIRTCDRLLRRQMLYPAELRVQYKEGYLFVSGYRDLKPKSGAILFSFMSADERTRTFKL